MLVWIDVRWRHRRQSLNAQRGIVFLAARWYIAALAVYASGALQVIHLRLAGRQQAAPSDYQPTSNKMPEDDHRHDEGHLFVVNHAARWPQTRIAIV